MDKADISFFNKYKKEPAKLPDSNSIRNSQSLSDEIEKIIISQPTEEDEYNCDNPNPGIALIFNHKNIKGQKPRVGTEKDRDAVHRTLLNFGYDVRVYNDLTYFDMQMVLVKTAQEDHSDNDCLIVVVMTHGMEQKLYAQDIPYFVEELWSPFLGANCKTLINKPKLFFIQACRGTNLEKPVTYVSPRLSHFGMEEIVVVGMAKALKVKKLPTFMYSIPNTADMLIMYSTFEKYYSFRNVENGSWFIQSLCIVLNDAAEGPALSKKGAELLRLLTAVNRKVAYEYQANSPQAILNRMKSMPNFLSTLTKTFYLRVKTNGQ